VRPNNHANKQGSRIDSYGQPVNGKPEKLSLKHGDAHDCCIAYRHYKGGRFC